MWVDEIDGSLELGTPTGKFDRALAVRFLYLFCVVGSIWR